MFDDDDDDDDFLLAFYSRPKQVSILYMVFEIQRNSGGKAPIIFSIPPVLDVPVEGDPIIVHQIFIASEN